MHKPLSSRGVATLVATAFLVALGCGSIRTLDPDGGGGADAGAGRGGAGGGGAGGSGGSVVTGNGGDGGGGGGGGGGSTDAGRDSAGCICSAIYAPVCGVDGRTYPSACNAGCAGVAVAHEGVCTDGGTADGGARGLCQTDSDCVFRANEGCCGTCAAATDPPVASGSCLGVLCAQPPGGCSCVNGQCMRGILTQGTACDLQQDACGSGLKCCRNCAAVGCTTTPICTGIQYGTSGQPICPLIP